jgi:sugar O-acyltransferase (sialic acid O-acetyltransferase NeuD family)
MAESDLVIIGAGGLGRVALEIALDINRVTPRWHILGFLDDGLTPGRQVGGLDIVGRVDWLTGRPDVFVVVAIGSPSARWRMVERLRAIGCTFGTLVHPSAWLASRAAVGQGCIVCPGVMVDPDVSFDDFVLLNKRCSVGHDSRVGAFSTLSPGCSLGGGVRIGDGCDLGMNSAVLPKVSVGSWSVVGAGAVVRADLPDNVTAVGVPARIIASRSAEWYR